MTKSKLVLVAAAIGLSGCAAMDSSATGQSARLQSAVYVKDDGANPLIQKTAAVPGESKAMKIYWFLAGR